MPSTTELRKSYLDTAKTLSTKPLYAWAGAVDLAVEELREVPAKVKGLRSEVSIDKLKAVPAAQKQFVVEVPGKLSAKVNSLPKTPKGIQAKLTEVTEAQVKAVDAQFDALADRGESVVKRIRSQKATTDLVAQAKTTVAKAKAVPTTAARTAAPAAKSTVTAVKSTATAARKTAAKAAPAASAAAAKTGEQA
ncbi:MAG: hypothetical protein ACT4QF_23120 [Sporichthyaceae bacterium]|jgi:heparin binding hemagglutinin HbhA